MHLFKNKTKDVKQFLQEMKANKTNRSSNAKTVEKRSNTSQSNSHSDCDSQYRSSQIGNQKTHGYDHQTKKLSSNVSNDGSNISFRGSAVSNPRSIDSVGNSFSQLPSQHFNSQQRSLHDQNHYQNPTLRTFANEKPAYNENQRFKFQQNVPAPIYNDFSQSNWNRNQCDPTRRQVEYEKPRQPHFNSYHSSSQSAYLQNNQNFNNFHDQRKGLEYRPNLSQNNSSRNHDQTEYCQKSNFISNSFPRQSQIHKPLPVSLLTHNLSQKIEIQSNQYDSLPMRNGFQNQKPIYQKMDSQRLFNSQINNIECRMEEICEAEDGFSTQKDSPTKLTEFLSKPKCNFIEIQQNPSKRHELLEEIRNSDILKNNIFSERQPRQTKIPSPNVLKTVSPLKIKPKFSTIKVSENEKCQLEKSLHQIDQVHMKLDGILKEASIIFNNIERSSQRFKESMSNGIFSSLLGNNSDQYSHVAIPRMQIEGQRPNVNVKEALTDKKVKPQANRRMKTMMDDKQTFKKTNSYREEIQI